MLRHIRIILALIFFLGITACFLDFTGTAHAYLGWMTRLQFLPAALAFNAVLLGGLVLLTLIFGRVYCSVICPLGVLQDIIAYVGKRGVKLPYAYAPAHRTLRYSFLALLGLALALAFLAGAGSLLALLDPYGNFGRIASSLLQPLYLWGNNALAFVAERVDSYAIYHRAVWLRSVGTLGLALAALSLVGYLAWKHGRTYCNALCPVGTLLGLLSRFALLRVQIDKSKCIRCGLCARKCKAKCIDAKQHRIDYSRCVACMDCLGNCSANALVYTWSFRAKELATAPEKLLKPVIAKKPKPATEPAAPADPSRREFFSIAGLLATATVTKVKQEKVDGGLAPLLGKKAPRRQTRLVPPGAQGTRHFAAHCTGCQLCVTACPNDLLRPGTSLLNMMQPEMSYENDFCRPECNRCGERCPNGAILPISLADKSSTQIGHAVWVPQNCIVTTKGVECGHCARSEEHTSALQSHSEIPYAVFCLKRTK